MSLFQNPNPSPKHRCAAAGLASMALLGAGLMLIQPAEARIGGGFSMGSRGYRTFTPPPSTRTAPGQVSPMQRSATPSPGVARPMTAANPSRFGGGFMGGFMGAGLIGLLLGAGLFAGLGSLTGLLGFALQLALLYAVVRFAMSYFAGTAAVASRPNAIPADTVSRYAGAPDIAPRGLAASGMSPMGAGKAIAIEPADFASFERLLGVTQLSFGRGDLAALRTAATPEMLGYFSDQLADNAKRGLRNELGSPKLTSGDLAEAWAEPGGEFATVAMRYALTDAMVETASGRVVSGSRDVPQDVTEVWTFQRRAAGGPSSWRLSAIQQVA